MKKFICSLLLGLSSLGCHKDIRNEIYKPYSTPAVAAYAQKVAPEKKIDIDKMLVDLGKDTKASMKRIKGYIQNIREIKESIKQNEQELRQYAKKMFGEDYDKDMCGMLDRMNKDLDERVKNANDLIAMSKKW